MTSDLKLLFSRKIVNNILRFASEYSSFDRKWFENRVWLDSQDFTFRVILRNVFLEDQLKSYC